MSKAPNPPPNMPKPPPPPPPPKARNQSLTDDNDLDRFIRCMGRRHLIKYRVALYHVTKPTGQQVADSTELRMIVATVEQKQAAIIKAMGWEGVTV